MDQSSGNKKYSAKDIERYHAGEMSATEMHALEKASMNDPFLADALEGYTFTSTAQNDLEQIRKRLEENKRNKKVIPLYSRTWFRVAAVVLILGAGGWLLTSRIQSENQKLASPSASILRKTDSTDVALGSDKNTQTSDSVKITSTEKMNANDEIIASSGTAHKNSDRLTPPGMVKSERRSEEYKAGRQFTDSMSKKDVVLQNASPVMNKDASLNPASRSASENFYRDSQSKDKEELSGKVAGVKVNDTLKNFDVTLKPMNDQVNEVVVSASTPLRKSKQGVYANVIVDTLEPAEGWVKYDDYIASNIRVPDEIRQKDVSGVVELSFDVDKNGLATNIKVEKSLCDRCDQEAIRLLKEGPKWTKKKNKKGKLKVKF